MIAEVPVAIAPELATLPLISAPLAPDVVLPLAPLRIWKWTKEFYYQAAALGWFADRRVELIDGEIVEMAAMLGPHARATANTSGALTLLFGIQDYSIRTQCPLDLGATFQPEPDIAVVTREVVDAAPAEGHPSTAVLVVEVSDSTLRRDQTDKASLYASEGIAEYWIINLVEDRIEVRREPTSAPEARFGHDYASLRLYRRGDALAPLARPDALLNVETLLA